MARSAGLFLQIERGADDHVLLAAGHAAAATNTSSGALPEAMMATLVLAMIIDHPCS
jgi:hypothetical protein